MWKFSFRRDGLRELRDGALEPQVVVQPKRTLASVVCRRIYRGLNLASKAVRESSSGLFVNWKMENEGTKQAGRHKHFVVITESNF